MLWPALPGPVAVMMRPALPDLDALGPPFTFYALQVFSLGLSTPRQLWRVHSYQNFLGSGTLGVTTLTSACCVGFSMVVLAGCTCFCSVLASSARVSDVAVDLHARNFVVGRVAGIYLVQSVYSCHLHFVPLQWSLFSASSWRCC